MDKLLQGKSAVVTGSGRGIGRSIALAFADQGARVVVVDNGCDREGRGTSKEPADEVVTLIKQRGGAAIASYESVADHAGAERIIKSCVDGFGGLDILVNVAGMLRERMVWNLTEDDWDAVVNTHLKGTYNCIRFASMWMREKKAGRIINTTSDAWRGTVGQCNYGAAKAGIVGLTRAVAREMVKYGVTVNAVAPMAQTRMTMTPEMKARWKQRLENGLITKEHYEELLAMEGPEYIPPIVVYLASEHASYISGQVFGSYGGQITRYSEPEPVKGIFRNHKKDGPWTPEELVDLMPKTLGVGVPQLAAKAASPQGN